MSMILFHIILYHNGQYFIDFGGLYLNMLEIIGQKGGEERTPLSWETFCHIPFVPILTVKYF